MVARVVIVGAVVAAVNATLACTGSSTSLPPSECAAWVDFYDTTRGFAWSRPACTGTRLDPCACDGITCAYEHITVLDMRSSSLNGTIPSTISNLDHLTELNLAGNQLVGTIPSTLPNLTRLTYLWLNGNRLTGTVPPLPFAQYTGFCCLEYSGTNHFECPLPPNTELCRYPPTCKKLQAGPL